MFTLFIAAIILLIVGVATGIFIRSGKYKKYSTVVIAATVVVSLGGIAYSCVRTVPTGHTGIVTTFGNVENYNFEAGVHICAPWNTVIAMDNRNQKASVNMECFSSDIQNVSVTYTLNYQIEKANAQTIYKQIGTDYYNTVIVPRIQEAVKAVMARYTAEELLENRAELSVEIRAILTEKLRAYNIEVIDTSLENLDFSDAFTDAVEAKQVAEQKSKQAKIEQEQKTMEAEAAAQRAKIEAEAAAERAKIEVESEAQVAKIAAEAELDVAKIKAEAAAFEGQKTAALIEKVRDVLAKDPENLTDEDINNLLVYYYIQKWNGELPSTYIGAEDFYELIGSLAGNGGTNP